MRIYREISDYKDSFYFMTTKENGLFCFSLALPDRNTLNLNACWIGAEREEKAYDNAIKVSVELNKKFNTFYDKKGNYDDVCSLLKEVFHGITQNDIDKAFDRDNRMLDITDRCINEYSKDVFQWHYRDIYQDVIYCMKLWDNDVDRVIKWIVSEKMPELNSFNDAMIDIFGEHHPTEYKLLHKFYHHWGKELDSIIEKCIAEYPDEKDFDLATYRCEELLSKRK